MPALPNDKKGLRALLPGPMLFFGPSSRHGTLTALESSQTDLAGPCGESTAGLRFELFAPWRVIGLT